LGRPRHAAYGASRPPRCAALALPQIREGFALLGYTPREDRLRSLLSAAGARMAAIARRVAERAEIKHRVYLKKRATHFNKIARARRRRLKQLRFGQGWAATAWQAAQAARGREVEATWRQRKLRPPGRMRRRF
jgi:hypothetical protein